MDQARHDIGFYKNLSAVKSTVINQLVKEKKQPCHACQKLEADLKKAKAMAKRPNTRSNAAPSSKRRRSA